MKAKFRVYGMKRKAEGIALLSLYNDEDDDGGDEEDEEEEDHAERSGANGAIVDYAHDEAAEIENGGTSGELTVCSPEEASATVQENDPQAQQQEQLKQQQQEGEEEEEAVPVASSSDEILISSFLPSPPTCKCSDELQDKFTWFLSLKEAGRSFNEELRNSKGYRNPDFLHRAVIHQGVDQLGSCFRKEIFDPRGYDPEDFYDELALQQKKEFERREQERKQNQKLEFVRANTLAVAGKMLQQKGLSVNATVPSLSDSASAAKPTTKKSKWDKVEPDVRALGGIPLSAQNALAAALVTANAAAMNYAQATQQAQALQTAQQQHHLQQHKRKEESKNKKVERS